MSIEWRVEGMHVQPGFRISPVEVVARGEVYVLRSVQEKGDKWWNNKLKPRCRPPDDHCWYMGRCIIAGCIMFIVEG